MLTLFFYGHSVSLALGILFNNAANDYVSGGQAIVQKLLKNIKRMTTNSKSLITTYNELGEDSASKLSFQEVILEDCNGEASFNTEMHMRNLHQLMLRSEEEAKIVGKDMQSVLFFYQQQINRICDHVTASPAVLTPYLRTHQLQLEIDITALAEKFQSNVSPAFEMHTPVLNEILQKERKQYEDADHDAFDIDEVNVLLDAIDNDSDEELDI